MEANKKSKENVDKIMAHLSASKDNAIVIRTYGHNTVIQMKHVEKFAKAGYQLITPSFHSNGESGFYLQSGKSKVYIGPDLVRFGGYR